MLRKLVLLCLLLTAFATMPHFAGAQGTPAWTANLDQTIYYAPMSDDGNTLVIFTKKGVKCYDVATGAVRWSRDMEKLYPGFGGHFISNSSFVFGNGDHFETVDVMTGTVQKTLPIIGESWKALRWEPVPKPDLDTMGPHFYGNLGVFYWDDGFQIIDFDKQVIVHSSPEPIKAVKYETSGDYALIWARAGADTAYFIDTKNNKLAYQLYTGSNNINASVYQHFVVNNDQMMIFTEKNTLSVNLPTQHVDAILPVDPDDPDVYVPVTTKDAMYLLTSDKNLQTMYDAKSGAQMWQTKEGAIPGYAEQFTQIEGTGDGLLSSYQKDGKIRFSRVNIKTGAIGWSKIIAEQDGSYSPGHHKSSSTLAVLGAVALQIAAAAANRGMHSGGGYNSRSGLGGGNGSGMSMSAGVSYHTSWAGVMNSTNRQQESDGIVKIVDMNANKVTLLCGGKMWTELEKTSRDKYDGEGVVILNLADGSVAKHLTGTIMSKPVKKSNPAKDLKFDAVGNAFVVVGSHDVHVLRGDVLESYNFPDEDITYIGADDKQVQFVCNHDGDYWDYWSVDPTGATTKKTLMARSLKNNFVFDGTAQFNNTLYYDKDNLQAFPLMSGDAAAKPDFKNPAWQLTEKDLDKLDVGNLTKNKDNTDDLQGIRVDGNDIYLMGTDKIGKAVINDQCRWATKWDPDMQKKMLGVTQYGKGIVYNTGSYCAVLSNDCTGAELGKHKISFGYASVLHTPNDDVVVLNKDDGLLFCYKLKKS